MFDNNSNANTELNNNTKINLFNFYTNSFYLILCNEIHKLKLFYTLTL